MTISEARFILSAVRADRLGEPDPRVTEALHLAESDPELREWFAESTRFDQAVASRLQEIAPPEGLRSSILAGIQVSPPVYLRRRSAILLATAAVLMLGVAAAIWMVAPGSGHGTLAQSGGTSTAAEFREGMIQAYERMKALDYLSEDPDEILAWLHENGIDDTATPAGEFGEERLVGCKILEWKGRKVSLVCFRSSESATYPDVHFFTVHAEAIEDVAQAFHETAPGEIWSTEIWSDGEHVHFVMAKGRHDQPRKLLPG